MNREFGHFRVGSRRRVRADDGRRSTRRRLLLALGTGALTAPLAAPLSAFAQQPGRVWRIGYLQTRTSSSTNEVRLLFMEGMRELGYVKGKNLAIEFRSAENEMERFPGLAAELVKLKVDLIVATSTPATAAAQRATASIPIVMVSVGDPVSSGFVKTLARPGGNITGTSSLTPDLGHKQLEMLLGIRPKLSRAAMLVDPDNTAHVSILKNVRAAAQGTGVTILSAEARTGAEIPQAISKASQEGVGALLVNGALFNGHLPRIAELALKYSLLSVSAFRRYSEAGGLMSYGHDQVQVYRRTATYVDKILKGTRPGDIPVEQPIKFELVVNMKTAKALGITIPQDLLFRADRVIE